MEQQELNKKLMDQLSKMIGLSFAILMMNTITIIVLSIKTSGNSFRELSFLVWGFVTICGWITAVIAYRQADIKFVTKKHFDK